MSCFPDNENADQRFRDAFLRLRINEPTVLPKNTPVSQANVAREAGVSPSALKKLRHPMLCRDIQDYVEAMKQNAGPSKSSQLQSARNNSALLEVELLEVKRDRDYQVTLKLYAQQLVLQLSAELEEYRKSNIINISSKDFIQTVKIIPGN